MALTTKPRPKVKASGQATVVTAVLAWLLDALGVDVGSIPPEVLVLAGGAIATAVAYVKRDGLAGAWHDLVHGRGKGGDIP